MTIREAKDSLDSKLRLLKADISQLQEICEHKKTKSEGTSDGENSIHICLDCDKTIVLKRLEA